MAVENHCQLVRLVGDHCNDHRGKVWESCCSHVLDRGKNDAIFLFVFYYLCVCVLLADIFVDICVDLLNIVFTHIFGAKGEFHREIVSHGQ